MNERVVADFVGEFYLTDMAQAEPVQGRVVMSPKRLVLVGEDGKTSIPTSAVFDVAVGHVPPEMREFFSDSVTIAYDEGDGRRMAIVEGDSDTIEKFATVLFKAILNGCEVTVEHPVRKGGRVVDTPPRRARIRVGDRTLSLSGPEVDLAIGLETITDFARETRTIRGESRAALEVRHIPGTAALVTAVSLPSDRRMNILGRYLRLEYSDLVEELSDIALSNEEVQSLVAIYSAGEGVDPVTVIEGDASRTTMVLNSLQEKGLVADDETGTVLTPKGRIVVNNRLEEVNA
jgi:helix-turn-helix protein